MERLRSLDAVAEELTRQHAEDQETLANNVILAMWPLWGIMDFEDLDESSIRLAEATAPLIRTTYMQSQRLAAAYEANVRFATLPVAAPLPILAPMVQSPLGIRDDHFQLPSFGSDFDGNAVVLDEPEMDDVKTSLIIESNFNVKAQMPTTAEDAMPAALVRTAGAAVRQSLKGARNVTHNVINMDRRVLGYARYTDGHPCHFCALLASRGAVYAKRSFVGGNAKFVANPEATDVPSDYVNVSRVHNNCKCTLRPVYSKSQAMDAEAKFYSAQWEKYGNVDDFRDNFQQYERKPADILDLQNQLREREVALLDAGFNPTDPQVEWARRTQTLLA